MSSCGLAGISPPRNAPTNFPISSGSSSLTPTVVRPLFVTAMSYQERSSWISWFNVPRSRSVSLKTVAGAGKETGQANTACSSDDTGASSGKSTSTAGPFGASSNSNTPRRTRVCHAASPGTPNGRPSSKGTHSARGGLILSVCSRIRLIWVVEIPSSSR